MLGLVFTWAYTLFAIFVSLLFSSFAPFPLPFRKLDVKINVPKG